MKAVPGPAPAQAKAPNHLWVVGALSLAWSGFGCFDFLMTNVRDAHTIAQLPPDVIDYLDALPGWTVIAWAIGVGFGFLGSLLLLGRSPYAAYAFGFSLAGLAGMQFYHFAVGLPAGMNTPRDWAMTALIWIVAVGLLLYAIRMRARRVLR